MKNKFNENDLINFEKEIFENYSEGKIKAPVHLVGSTNKHQEKILIKIFKKVNEQDYIFGTHRSHYIALLKSQDSDWVKNEIFSKRSSHINSKKHKIFTSAIVGGNLPIALGVALAIKQRKKKNHVWCFVGDMAAKMGIFHECERYARNFDLPITFIVEDNHVGVYTPTSKAWGSKKYFPEGVKKLSKYVLCYYYKRRYPHYGVGKWVTF